MLQCRQCKIANYNDVGACANCTYRAGKPDDIVRVHRLEVQCRKRMADRIKVAIVLAALILLAGVLRGI